MSGPNLADTGRRRAYDGRVRIPRAVSRAMRSATVGLIAITAIPVLTPILHQAAQAAELPRFIAEPQLAPLRDALYAYSSGALPQAHEPPVFIAAGGSLDNAAPHGSLALGNMGDADANADLTTQDLQNTLRAARQDAGEARALADEMSRRAAEISDRLAAQGDTSLPDPLSAPPAVTANAPAAPAADVPAAGRPAVAMLPPPPPSAPPRFARATFAPPAIAGQITSVVSPPLPGSADVAGRSRDAAETAEDKRETKPELVRRRTPLPGLMALGGAKRASAEGPDETTAVQAETADPAPPPIDPSASIKAPSAAAITAVDSNSTAPVPMAGTNATDGTDAAAGASPAAIAPAAATTRERSAPLHISKSAAAAYGFVPLSRPKDPVPQARASSGPSPDAARGRPQSDPESRIVAPRTPQATRPGNASAAGPAPQVSGNPARAEPAPVEAETADKGLIGWFKALGKPFKVPNEIGPFGWSKQ